MTGTPIYTPINEISFFSWAAAEVGWFFPHARNRGGELKRQLIRACIAGIEAIWAVDARARIAMVEPLIHVVAPRSRPDLAAAAAAYRNSQFEACDMLAGTLAPELGGQPRYLDIVGVNFYHDNQWEQPGGEKIAWHVLPRDPRWRPFHLLLAEIYERFRRPIFVAETSHVGSGRAEWLRELTDELTAADCRRHSARRCLPVSHPRSLRVGRSVALAQQRPLGSRPDGRGRLSTRAQRRLRRSIAPQPGDHGKCRSTLGRTSYGSGQSRYPRT